MHQKRVSVAVIVIGVGVLAGCSGTPRAGSAAMQPGDIWNAAARLILPGYAARQDLEEYKRAELERQARVAEIRLDNIDELADKRRSVIHQSELTALTAEHELERLEDTLTKLKQRWDQQDLTAEVRAGNDLARLNERVGVADIAQSLIVGSLGTIFGGGVFGLLGTNAGRKQGVAKLGSAIERAKKLNPSLADAFDESDAGTFVSAALTDSEQTALRKARGK